METTLSLKLVHLLALIERVRQITGLTAIDLAKLLRVDIRNITDWSKQNRLPRWEYIEKLMLLAGLHNSTDLKNFIEAITIREVRSEAIYKIFADEYSYELVQKARAEEKTQHLTTPQTGSLLSTISKNQLGINQAVAQKIAEYETSTKTTRKKESDQL
jgi:hypothetical protein